jgi:dethiobiotin synthetase
VFNRDKKVVGVFVRFRAASVLWFPVIVGSINHTLLTIEALQNREIKVARNYF